MHEHKNKHPLSIQMCNKSNLKKLNQNTFKFIKKVCKLAYLKREGRWKLVYNEREWMWNEKFGEFGSVSERVGGNEENGILFLS